MSGVEMRQLGEIASVRRGYTKPIESDDGVVFFGVSEILAGGSGRQRIVVDQGDGPRNAAERVHEGDVVVALMAAIGQSALISARHEGAVLSRECAVIRPEAEVSGAWLYIWTQSTDFREQVTRHTSGSTVPRLSYRALNEMLLPVPSAARRADAEALVAEFDGALERLGQVRSHLQELRAVEIELLLADLDGDE